MADFSSFELGNHSVYDLAHELVPDIAEVFGHVLTPEPNIDNLGELIGVVGKKKTLQDNILDTKAQLVEYAHSEEEAIELASAWLEASGVQKHLHRSLWSPKKDIVYPDAIVITGAVANWQDRTAQLLINRAKDLQHSPVYIPVGNREMNTATELANNNVQAWMDQNDEIPTEARYARDVVMPRLEEVGYDPILLPYDTSSGDELAGNLFENHPYLADHQILYARVANAGVQLAVQFRQQARKLDPRYDTDPNNPQVFIATDSFPIARTVEQAKNAREFQNPFAGLTQVLKTAQCILKAEQVN